MINLKYAPRRLTQPEMYFGTKQVGCVKDFTSEGERIINTVPLTQNLKQLSVQEEIKLNIVNGAIVLFCYFIASKKCRGK